MRDQRGHGQEGSQGIVTRSRTWGWSRIWEEKLALVRTCHSGRPAAAPELETADDRSAPTRRRRIVHGHAAARRQRMAAPVPAVATGRPGKPARGGRRVRRPSWAGLLVAAWR